jgi:hypothetical protein
MKISRKCAVPSARSAAPQGKPKARSHRDLERFPDTLGQVVYRDGKVLKPAAAIFAAEGAQACLEFLGGGETRFNALAGRIQQQVKYWERVQRRMGSVSPLFAPYSDPELLPLKEAA